VQQAFRDVVKDFAQRGRAVLFSSHVLSEVESVCHRVAILRAGEVVALEAIEALRDKVVRKMTVRFAGTAPAGLGEVPGVDRSEARGAEVTLWVRGDVNPVLRALAAHALEDVVFPEAQLEDIFMAYYRA
jgi:ABC-2 type transport system ATP-binding protein